MKKRISAFLVMCMLTATFMLPAAAAQNPDYIADITQQPPKTLFVVYGDEINLEIQAEAPKEGDGSPLRYQWYKQSNFVPLPGEERAPTTYFDAIEGAQAAALTLSTDDLLLYSYGGELYLHCKVTAKLKDGSESVVTSAATMVFVYYDWNGAIAKLKDTWISSNEDFNFFVALAHVAIQSFNFAAAPFYFASEWLRHQPPPC